MFGCIVAGRAPLLGPQLVAPGKYLFSLEEAQRIGHLVVFLLDGQQQPLPPSMCAAIYWGWPPYKEFKLLGYLTNQKPSAVFRVGAGSSASSTTNNVSGDSITEVEMITDEENVEESVVAQLGISVEPLEVVQQQMEQRKSTQALAKVTPSSGAGDMVTFVRKMLENLFNYALSFDRTAAPSATWGTASSTSTNAIPVAVLKSWYSNFESKLQKDPFFWKT